VEETSKQKGALAESIARQFAEENGYIFVQANYFGKSGEIDLILRDGECLVFVEVKSRWSASFGAAEFAVNKQKLIKMKKTAQEFLYKTKTKAKEYRFDMMALNWKDGVPEIVHYKNVLF